MTIFSLAYKKLLLILVVCAGVIDVFGQDDIQVTSSLDPEGRRYVCPGEKATYVFRGTGNFIDFYAPPYVTSDLPLSFARGHTMGANLCPLFGTLVMVDEPFIEAQIVVTNSSITNLTIICEIPRPSELGRPQTIQVKYQLSGPPLDVISPTISSIGTLNDESGTVNVSWTPSIGSFDHRAYHVQLYDNKTVINSIDRDIDETDKEASTVFTVPLNTEVKAKITTVSFCNDRSNGVFTGGVTVDGSIPLSSSMILMTVSALIAIFTFT